MTKNSPQALLEQLQSAVERLNSLENLIAVLDSEKYELTQRVQLLEDRAGIKHFRAGDAIRITRDYSG